MDISVKGEYALLALLDLSLQPPGEPVKIRAIAKRQGIPQKFLELILTTLKQGGFVASRRGAEGGYVLARPADRIPVGEVLRFVEGSRSKRGARRDSENPFSGLWKRVDDSVSEILDKATVAGVARTWQERQIAHVPDWEI